MHRHDISKSIVREVEASQCGGAELRAQVLSTVSTGTATCATEIVMHKFERVRSCISSGWLRSRTT